MFARRPRLFLHLALLPLIVSGCDCVHRRQAMYPGGLGRPVDVQAGRGVRVRAPFVDVQVPEKDPEPPVMLGE
jgi:hypothetical protein